MNNEETIATQLTNDEPEKVNEVKRGKARVYKKHVGYLDIATAYDELKGEYLGFHWRKGNNQGNVQWYHCKGCDQKLKVVADEGTRAFVYIEEGEHEAHVFEYKPTSLIADSAPAITNGFLQYLAMVNVVFVGHTTPCSTRSKKKMYTCKSQKISTSSKRVRLKISLICLVFSFSRNTRTQMLLCVTI